MGQSRWVVQILKPAPREAPSQKDSGLANRELPGRRSNRLTDYDYAKEGAYFVTLCTYENRELFGGITDDEMHLNPAGRIAEEEWLKTATVRHNVQLDEWVLMPNHLHGIIVITEMWATHRVAPTVKGFGQGPGRSSLGAIIGQYKSCVTRRLRKELHWTSRPVWQRNYYDRIVRNDDELNAVRQYIENNPKAWELDNRKSIRPDKLPNP